MEFNEKLIQFGKRAKELKSSISTEEATKTSIVMPFFQLLGYDVFNPLEFVPEFTADVGIKKGEKVDYAIMLSGKPAILIECKPCNKKLDKYGSQLFRYFSVTESRFAILTNGIKYNFYTDLDDVNKMDSTPFLEVDITKLSENDFSELKKFHKVNFDSEVLYSAASELKYYRTIKDRIQSLYMHPSDEFVRLIISPIYSGVKTQNVIERFKPIVQKSFNDFISTLVNNSLAESSDARQIEPDPLKISSLLSQDETEVFYKIRDILGDVIEKELISYKVTESYLSVIIDNKPRKWICRFAVGMDRTLLMLPSEKNIKKIKIDNINEIEQLSNELHNAAARLLKGVPSTNTVSDDHKELPLKSVICGQKEKVSSIAEDNELSVTVNIPKLQGCDIDLACFGVNRNDVLEDEQYFVFYNQPESENGSIKMLFSNDELSNGFEIDLDLLPKSIQKIVVTASIDGIKGMKSLGSSDLHIWGSKEKLHYDFNGASFGDEKAIVLAEIYRKNDDWTISIVSKGFNGGLDALLEHYGGTAEG